MLKRLTSERKIQISLHGVCGSVFDQLDEKARDKIIYNNIRKAQVTNDKELFKKLTEEIWEFRTLYSKTYYRLFAFWDRSDNSDTVVISTHGLIKKTGKTPQADLG